MKTLLALILACSLFAGTYDYEYNVVKNTNEIGVATKALDEFMYGDFKEIIRFDMLSFDVNGGNLSVNSRENFDYIVKTIKDYEKREDIRITIIGHTNRPTDDYNEQVVDSDTYANAIQNLFRSSLDTNTSADLSKNYANAIQEKLVDSNIDKSITVVEYRRGDDLGFTDATTEGRDLSNRVMVTMYVNSPEELAKPVKTIKPIILVKQEEPFCEPVEIDSDGDGVLDSSDECPGTPKGFKVDTVGCITSKDLHVNFASNSYVIPQETRSKVVEFAIFLKEYPAYKALIIGHTDYVGKEEANIILSQNRAASVKTALVSEGVSASRLTTEGHGELEPIQTNATEEGRYQNRRTEIRLSY
jgi:outer membrane protein OmpA-like peptidoglycan-associated protein